MKPGPQHSFRDILVYLMEGNFGNFPRMIQVTQKLSVFDFFNFIQFSLQFLSYFLAYKDLNSQQRLTLVSSGCFWICNWKLLLELASQQFKTKKKTQKARFWQSDPNDCSSHEKICGKELPLTWTLKQKFIRNVISEKKEKGSDMKFLEFTTKCRKIRIFSLIYNIVIIWTLSEIYFNQKSHRLNIEKCNFR